MRIMARYLHMTFFALVLSLCVTMVAAAETSDFTFTLNSNGNGYAVTGYSGGESSVKVPDWYNSLPVTEIGNGAFQGNQSLKSVSLPNTIERIGVAAFKNCSALSKMTSYNAAAEPPAEPTATPAEPTETPAEPTATPTEPTETPAEPTEPPAEPTATPAEPTATPAEPTETPAEPTETPADPTATPATERIPGDVNGDGKINSRDALLIIRYASGQDVNINLNHADVNADGKVNSRDALLIIRYASGQDVKLK